jgi:uncharacterized membrane protein
MMNHLIARFRLIGTHPFCSGHRSRAPIINGWCFPLCYRCTAFVVAFTVWKFTGFRAQVGVTALMMAPMAIDGGMQYLLNIESTTLRRIITGMLAGIGVALI